MDIQMIRNNARKLYQNNSLILTYAFFVISSLTACFQLLNSGWLILLANIILVTIPHGMVYLSLKVIQNNNLENLSYYDILIGLIQFLKYLPSYLTRMLMIYLSTYGLLLPAFFISSPGSELSSYTLMSQVVQFIVQRGFNISYTSHLILNMKPICYIFIIGALFIYIILTLSFIFVPYIVEDYDYSWLEALKKSIELIRGHFSQCIHLIMSFLPNIVIYNMMTLLISIPLSFFGAIGSSILLVIMLLLQIRLYLVEFHISIAMFYLQIRDEKKDENELFKIK